MTLTALTEGVDYTLDEGKGEIQEDSDFGAGVPVVVTYFTDFQVPTAYPGPPNGSPDVAEDVGDWTGLPLVDGLYSLGIQAARSFIVDVSGETTSYRIVSPSQIVQLQFGDTVADPVLPRIDSAETCASCHVDIQFHGSNRGGVETCLLCHSTAGAEDRARYVAANAGATEGVLVEFREMLHKIHHGAELAKADEYTVNGFGFGYPDNFTPHQYGHVEFPWTRGGTSDCASCHGADNLAWQAPAPRMHPLQTVPTKAWTVACGSCHDSDAATAHIEAQTSPTGAESCAICHGEGEDVAVEKVHAWY